ncbi:MAG: hypothetical protein OXU20_20870 [Myxococcales bacterium]|nr:hypothetical protein [Myxococcales bacterium]
MSLAGYARAASSQWGVAACVAACAWFTWELLTPATFIDDAYISFRYARNLVEGHGLVWNAGERVEGITNLLWTLCIAAGMALGAEAGTVAHAMSLLCGVGALVLCYATAREGLPERQRAAAGVAPWLLLSTVAFPIWARSGLEAPMVALWSALAAWALVTERPWLATLAVSLACLTRPDGILLVPPLLVWGVADPREGFKRMVRRAAPHAAVVALALVAISGFRFAYYGAPLPNTFYAKVGGIPWHAGVAYMLAFLFSGVLLWLPFAFSGTGAEETCEDRAHGRLRRATAGWLVLHILYNLAIGGDAFLHSRFFIAVLPPLCALTAIGTARALSLDGIRSGILAGACLVAFIGASWLGQPYASAFYASAGLIAVVSAWTGRSEWRAEGLALGCAVLAACLAFVRPPALQGELLFQNANLASPRGLGRAECIRFAERFNGWSGRMVDSLAARIKAHAPVPSPIAAVAIGRLGYRVPVRIIDVLGLTEPAIARAGSDETTDNALPGHQRSNADHVLLQAPALILMPRNAAISLPAVQALVQHPDFTRNYTYDPSLPGYRRQAPHDARPATRP